MLRALIYVTGVKPCCF